MGNSTGKNADHLKDHERATQNQRTRVNPDPRWSDLGIRRKYVDLHGSTVDEDISEYLRGTSFPRRP